MIDALEERHAAARKYAIAELQREYRRLVAIGISMNTIGASVFAAINALPDDRLFSALPDNVRKPLEQALAQLEINWGADKGKL